MGDKYRYTATELFKLRMQFKAQVNSLRKTYHEVVFEKNQPEKKHFYNSNSIPQTQIIPAPERSLKKLVRQRRHYSPIGCSTTYQAKSLSCKKQFNEPKSSDNLSKVLTQKYQSKKKSLSQALLSKSNISIPNKQKKYETGQNSYFGAYQSSQISTPKSGIKIIPKYHQYDQFFLG